MARRSYSQYCAVARGLDLIGDRWTLLMVRDMLLGPKRFKDILEALPGIGTNLLSTRLRELEDAGLIERAVLPPPAGSAVYRLTASGEALEPVVVALGRWGGRFLGEPLPTDVFIPSAYFVAMRASFRPERAAALNERYEFRIDGHVFEVAVADGRCSTREGGSTNPTVSAAMDVRTLNALLLEGLRPADGIADGRIEASGDAGALDRFANVFATHRLTAVS
jgi:DNA-binding HxlR family transcriptional regulator/putative sterol carrier protein